MDKDMLLTDEGLAGVFNVSVNTVRSWKHRNQIPEQVIFKLPNTKKGTVRYIKSKVEDWINGCLSA